MTRKGKDIYFTYFKDGKEKRGFTCLIDGIDTDTVEERIEKLKKKYGTITNIVIYDNEFTFI